MRSRSKSGRSNVYRLSILISLWRPSTAPDLQRRPSSARSTCRGPPPGSPTRPCRVGRASSFPVSTSALHSAQRGARSVRVLGDLADRRSPGRHSSTISAVNLGVDERRGRGFVLPCPPRRAPSFHGSCPPAQHGHEELVVGLLRSVGWLSRFDLSSRTTGVGPMMATPEAQCQGPQSFSLTTALGHHVAEDADLAGFAATRRAPLRAWQLRPNTTDHSHRATAGTVR